MTRNKILNHNVLETPWPMQDESVDVIVTSPPYWGLRDYGTGRWEGGDPECEHDTGGRRQVPKTITPGAAPAIVTGAHRGAGDNCMHCGAWRVDDQIGLEQTPDEYVDKLVQVLQEAHRVLKSCGTLWLNLADTYWGGKSRSGGSRTDAQGAENALNAKAINFLKLGDMRPQDGNHEEIKPKDLVGIPWMVAFALRKAGWYLRQDIIWHKPNPMPESVTDRCTKAHEYLFMLTKSRYYYFDQDAILQPASAGTAVRLDQNIEGQEGSSTPSKANGPMKAVSGPWEGVMANKRSVWTVTTKPFDGEYCTACARYYSGRTKNLIRTKEELVEGKPLRRHYCLCGRSDAWVAHFATFPEDLITDCVKAGSSQHGNCGRCGAPWERILEDLSEKGHDGTTDSSYPEGSAANRLALLRQKAREEGEEYSARRKTRGWRPTCNCQESTVVRPLVLDCFMGGGTTALVALSQGRDFVGLELNPHFIGLATGRLKEHFGMFIT